MVNVHNGIRLGWRTRHAIRLVARIVNPLVLLIAGRGWMPVLGILYHQGRRSGRIYVTPLAMRPYAGGFVMPRTFGENAAWYLNIRATGYCEVTYRGKRYRLAYPEVVDFAAAAPAFPHYERAQIRLLGINEFLRLRFAPQEQPRAKE